MDLPLPAAIPLELRPHLEKMPWLASPAHLAYADTNGKWIGYKHLLFLNEQLSAAGLTAAGYGDVKRLGVHLPFQHGKTWLASKYFPAWVLLLFPWLRIIVASHSEDYSVTIGRDVREVVERFGSLSGVKLRQDTKAKGEWIVDAGKGMFESGGMVCRGFKGGINGRSCDLMLLDDVLKDAADALSPAVLENQWNWYTSVAYSRLSKNAPIVMVTTRWVKNDLPGRIYRKSKETGEKWKEIKLKAIAGDDDPLGRKPGEALWPEEKTLEFLEIVRKQSPRWFSACYQQEPTEEEGLYFRPRRTKDHFGWPRYTDLGDAWSIARGSSRDVVRKVDCTRIVGIDWAMGKKRIGGDYAGFVLGDRLPDGRVLIPEAVRRKARIDTGDGVRSLDEFCKRMQPRVAASDDDMIAGSVANECRRYPAIPEIRRLPISGQNKLVRASEAMAMGENSRLILPESAPWLDDFENELTEFDGLEGGLDDMVDGLGIVCRVAQQMRGGGGSGPTMLVPGKA